MMGLKEAFNDYKKNEGEQGGQMEGEHEPAEEQESAAVLHINHGKHHSKHKISHEGEAESEMHQAGEGGDDCPHCG